MDRKKIYVTIDHIDDYGWYDHLNVNDELILKKEERNRYDDEAIAVFGKDGDKIGYVANSVNTVARGTYSAGRLYENMDEEILCRIMFKTQDQAIAVICEEE